MNWSTSKLALAHLCGFAFGQDRAEVPRPPHPALDGGTWAHDALCELVRVVIDDEPIDIEGIARRIVPGRPQERADVISILANVQEELGEEEPPFTPSAVIYREERLATQIGPHVFDGKADLVEAYGRTCVVSDWKTHWKPESQQAFDADEQVPRYAFLVDENNPGRFDRFVIRKRFVRYKGAVRERVLTRSDLEVVRWGIVDDIEEAERLVAAADFKPTPGDWCSVCSRTDVCPVLQSFKEHGFDMVAIDSDAKAKEAAGLVRVIDAHSQKLKRLLKVYLGAEHRTGRVELSGGSYGFGPSNHKRAAVEDVVEIYAAHDRPLNLHALRVDVPQLTRGLDREPGTLRRAMASAIEEYQEADCRYRRGDGTQEEEATDA